MRKLFFIPVLFICALSSAQMDIDLINPPDSLDPFDRRVLSYIMAADTCAPKSCQGFKDKNYYQIYGAIKLKFGKQAGTDTCNPKTCQGFTNTDLYQIYAAIKGIKISGGGSDTAAWKKGGNTLTGATKFGSNNANDVIFISSGSERARLAYNGHWQYTSSIYDSGDNVFLDPTNKAVYGVGGLLCLDAANSTLGVGTSISINFGSNQLNDGPGNVSIDYGQRQEKNSAGVTVFEYENGTGYTSGSKLVLDLNNQHLMDGPDVRVDWKTGFIFYQNANVFCDWGNGSFYSNAGTQKQIDLYNVNQLSLVPVTGSVSIGNIAASAKLHVSGNILGTDTFSQSMNDTYTSMYSDGSYFTIQGNKPISINSPAGVTHNGQMQVDSSQISVFVNGQYLINADTTGITGSFQFLSGSPGAGKVCATDANGVVFFQAAGVMTHTVFTPVTTNTVSVIVNKENAISPAGTIAALTIKFPNSPSNNDFVIVSFDQVVTSVTYSAGTGNATIKGQINGTVGGWRRWFYDASTNTWY